MSSKPSQHPDAPPPETPTDPDNNDDALRIAVAFLNEHFSPWTYRGAEPVALALAALIRDRQRWPRPAPPE